MSASCYMICRLTCFQLLVENLHPRFISSSILFLTHVGSSVPFQCQETHDNYLFLITHPTRSSCYQNRSLFRLCHETHVVSIWLCSTILLWQDLRDSSTLRPPSPTNNKLPLRVDRHGFIFIRAGLRQFGKRWVLLDRLQFEILIYETCIPKVAMTC